MTVNTKSLYDPTTRAGSLYSSGWQTATGPTLPTLEPATGTVLAEVGTASADDTNAACAAAKRAQAAWAARPAQERAKVLRRAAAELEACTDEYVPWLVRESGSIPGKAHFEVA